jgi:hypothetical protein
MVGAGTLFSYLSAFVTIVLALGLSDLLTSLHRLLRNARTVRWAALPLVAAVLIALALFSEFFTIWQLTMVSEITFVGLFLHFLPTFFIFLAASTVFPDSIESGAFDFDAFYWDNQHYLYLTLAFAFALDAPRAIQAEPSDLDGALSLVLPGLIVAAICVAMAFTRRRSVHWAGLVFMLALMILNFSMHSISGPAAVLASPTENGQ